jgi:hypothetical protein
LEVRIAHWHSYTLLAELTVSRAIDDANDALESRKQLLAQLLPFIDFNSTPDLTREKVMSIISSDSSLASASPAVHSDAATTMSPNIRRNSDGLDESDHEWDETREQQQTSPVGDDVNGLAVKDNKAGSYVGVSSISAALRALFIVCPEARRRFLQLGGSFLQRNMPQSLLQGQLLPEPYSLTLKKSISAPKERAVDAYFEHFHSMVPMIDEVWFRQVFDSQARRDDAWVALSNMVLALGSIAAGDDKSHAEYHRQAQKVVGYNVFESGNLEMLQALILMGGSYLHYINSPNTCYLILGTAFRMAIAMALHRDPCRGGHVKRQTHEEPASATGRLRGAEIKRRTWWSLICMDAWAGISLGRPSFKRWDPLTMDTALPTDHRRREDDEPSNDLDGDQHRDWTGTCLRLSAEFCKISSKIDYRLAQISRLTAREVVAFDNELLTWDQSRPVAFRLGTSLPSNIRFSRDNMIYRLLIARLVVSRPLLLRLAEDPTAASTINMEDVHVLSICREAASTLIDEISANPSQNRIFVWHCSWYLFQACMVPLLSIALASRSPPWEIADEETINRWRKSLDIAIRKFRDMAPFTRASDRYGEVIEALYAGITRRQDQYPVNQQPPSEVTYVPAYTQCPTPNATFLGEQIIPPQNPFSWLEPDLAFGNEHQSWQFFSDGWTAHPWSQT